MCLKNYKKKNDTSYWIIFPSIKNMPAEINIDLFLQMEVQQKQWHLVISKQKSEEDIGV